MTTARAGSTPRRAAFAAAFAALAALLVVLGATTAEALQSKQLGRTDQTPSPQCPEDSPGDPCLVEGSVTAIQVEADGRRGLFKAKEDGQLVAWAIDLSRPTESQQDSFGDLFRNNAYGKNPTAGVGILGHVGNSRYRLKAQSPVMELQGSLGDTQTFTLNDPLPMKDGDILALTLPTWAPAFALKGPDGANRWKASRQPGECSSREDIVAGRPQRKIDSIRKYGCDYQGARLLYWGWFVPDA